MILRCRAAGHSRLCSLALTALLALAALGCQGRGDVSGKVTSRGKPLVFGTILFVGSDGILRQSNLAKDGSYAVHGVRTGEARVAVHSPNPRRITVLEGPPYPNVPGWFAIPKHYESIDTSGLTYTIKGGSNMIDIELK